MQKPVVDNVRVCGMFATSITLSPPFVSLYETGGISPRRSGPEGFVKFPSFIPYETSGDVTAKQDGGGVSDRRTKEFV